MENQRCFKCKSTFKVKEIEPGTYCCSGICEIAFLRNKEKMASPSSKWKVGDRCRAIYSEDGLEYEGTILILQSDAGGKPYCQVQFAGYGNKENVWLTDLKSSLGPQAVRTQEEEAAKDAIVEWKVGDRCRAFLSSDGLEYEAEILSVAANEEGDKFGEVRFAGMDVEETVWFSQIIKSQGQDEWDRQVAKFAKPPAKDAAKYPPGANCRAVDPKDGVAYEAIVVALSQEGEEATVKFCGYGHEASVKSASLADSLGDEEIKKQVPVAALSAKPKWSVNDACRAVYSEDGIEYEGDIIALAEDPNSHDSYATVRFVGYGNEENIWLKDLLKSHGVEARQDQERASSADGGEEAQAIPQPDGPALPDDKEEKRPDSEKMLEAKIEELTKGKADLDAKVKELAKDKADLDAKVKELTKDKADFDAKIKELGKTSMAEVEQLKLAKLTLAKGNEELLSEIQKLRKAEGDGKDSRVDAERFRREKERSLEDMKKLIAKVDQLKSENVRLQKEIDRLRAEKTENVAELVRTRTPPNAIVPHPMMCPMYPVMTPTGTGDASAAQPMMMMPQFVPVFPNYQGGPMMNGGNHQDTEK